MYHNIWLHINLLSEPMVAILLLQLCNHRMVRMPQADPTHLTISPLVQTAMN
jgi:hypothetical protein